MSDLSKLLDSYVKDIVENHAKIMEDELQSVLDETGKSIEDIELQVHPSFKYKIMVKHKEFEFNHNFDIRNL